MLEFGPRPPSAAYAPPPVDPKTFGEGRVLGLAKQLLAETRDTADLGTAGWQPRADMKGMPSGMLQAPVDTAEMLEYGQAQPPSVRELPVQEFIAEPLTQRQDRYSQLHANNQADVLHNQSIRAQRLMEQTAPSVMAQTAADMQRQAEALQNQQLRYDQTPVASISPEALDYALKHVYGQPMRRPSVM